MARVISPDDLAKLYEMRRVAWVNQARGWGAGDDAEDAVQETMVAVLEGVEPAQDEPLDAEPPHSGLIPRLIRLFSDRRRLRDRRHRSYVSREEVDRGVYRIPLQTRIDVQRAVDSLDEAELPWLVWRGLVAGETVRELAGQLKVSWWVVAKRLRRAKAQLVETLAPYRGERRVR